jgi:hypothetical protein
MKIKEWVKGPVLVWGLLIFMILFFLFLSTCNNQTENNDNISELENLKILLEQDNVSTNKYDANEYDCRMYVRDLKSNLENKGYDVEVVSISLKDNETGKWYGHTCLYWKDNYFIEAQTDNIFHLKENMNYWGLIVKDFVVY